MSVTASDYQSLKLQIKGLEKIAAELKRDNGEKVKIIAEQAKLIEELKLNSLNTIILILLLPRKDLKE